MKVCLIANSDGALYHFRGSLIRRLVARGASVNIICGASDEGSYADKLMALGVSDVKLINFSGASISIMSFFALILKIRKIVASKNINIIHSYTHKACIASGYAALSLPRDDCQLVFTITGLGRVFSKSTRTARVLQRLILTQYCVVFRRVSVVFFQNPDDMELMIREAGLARSKCKLVGGSGVDLQEFNPSLNKAGGELLRVACLSRGLTEKGFNEFYDCADRLTREFPGRFTFCHAGIIDPTIASQIAPKTIYEFAMEKKVDYLGFVSDVKSVLAAADIIVHQSYYREGVPRSLIESLAMDKYIITCNTVGNREVVIDNWNGKFCEPRSLDSLCSAIVTTNRELLNSIKGRSRELAVKKFDVDAIDSEVLEAYGFSMMDSG